jgi:hypothetical protein
MSHSPASSVSIANAKGACPFLTFARHSPLDSHAISLRKDKRSCGADQSRTAQRTFVLTSTSTLACVWAHVPASGRNGKSDSRPGAWAESRVVPRVRVTEAPPMYV